jgi:dephospho-CoA kinase
MIGFLPVEEWDMKIAISGGIGTGKSEVLKVLKDAGMRVESADLINKNLLNNNLFLNKLILFFPECKNANGNFDFKKLKELIFNNAEKRNLLNSIAHPKILQYIKNIKTEEIIFIEIPLLVESKSAYLFDKIWAVKSSDQSRIERITKRDFVSASEAIKYLAVQEKENEVYNFADEIIVNEGDLLQLHEQVMNLLKKNNYIK